MATALGGLVFYLPLPTNTYQYGLLLWSGKGKVANLPKRTVALKMRTIFSPYCSLLPKIRAQKGKVDNAFPFSE